MITVQEAVAQPDVEQLLKYIAVAFTEIQAHGNASLHSVAKVQDWFEAYAPHILGDVRLIY